MSDLYSYVRQNSNQRQYRKISLQAQQRKMQHAKRMKKRKHPKKHRQINIQVMKNSYLQEKLSKQLMQKKYKAATKQQMVVVIPYNQFQDLVDFTQKIKRSKTSLKRRLTFINMSEDSSSLKFPAINRQKLSSVNRGNTNSSVYTQNNQSLQLNPKKGPQKKLKKMKTQIQNHTQSMQNQVSKEQFNEFMTNVKQKLLKSSFHIEGNPTQ